MEDCTLEENCTLCLQHCKENVMEEIESERFNEIIDFVFTFEIVCTTSEAKLCHSCYSVLIKFYEYAIRVKENQACIMNFRECITNLKVGKESEVPPDCSDSFTSSVADISEIKIEHEHALKDADQDEANAVGEDEGIAGDVIESENNHAYDSAHAEQSNKSSKKRKKRNGESIQSCTTRNESFSNMVNRKSRTNVNCKVCGMPFSNRRILRDHMKQMHNNDCRAICDKCGKTFGNNNSLDYHMKASHKVGPAQILQCEICLESFNNGATLRSHKRSIHDEAGQTFTCDVCDRSYPTSRSLRGHKQRVHVEEKFCCEICQRQFKRKVNFKEHMAAHTGETLYNCDVCGLSFKSNANMYSHRKRKHPVEWQAKQKVVKNRRDDS